MRQGRWQNSHQNTNRLLTEEAPLVQLTNFIEYKRAKTKCANYLRACEGRCFKRNCGTASVGKRNTKICYIKRVDKGQIATEKKSTKLTWSRDVSSVSVSSRRREVYKTSCLNLLRCFHWLILRCTFKVIIWALNQLVVFPLPDSHKQIKLFGYFSSACRNLLSNVNLNFRDFLHFIGVGRT